MGGVSPKPYIYLSSGPISGFQNKAEVTKEVEAKDWTNQPPSCRWACPVLWNPEQWCPLSTRPQVGSALQGPGHQGAPGSPHQRPWREADKFHLQLCPAPQAWIIWKKPAPGRMKTPASEQHHGSQDTRGQAGPSLDKGQEAVLTPPLVIFIGMLFCLRAAPPGQGEKFQWPRG